MLFPSSKLPQVSPLLSNLFLFVFFLGCEDNRKISWIDWDSNCLEKEVGGLGLSIYHLALLEGGRVGRINIYHLD